MLIETRLWILISSKSRWKFFILRKKWMWAVFFLDLENITQDVDAATSCLFENPLGPHAHLFLSPVAQGPQPSLPQLPSPLPTPSQMTHRNIQGLLPQWAGFLIMINCLCWSYGLTLSKAIWCWDKTGMRREQQRSARFEANQSCEFNEVRRDLGSSGSFGKTPSWTQECPEAKATQPTIN